MDIDGNGRECRLCSGANLVLLEEHCSSTDHEILQLHWDPYELYQVCEEARPDGAANTFHEAGLL